MYFISISGIVWEPKCNWMTFEWVNKWVVQIIVMIVNDETHLPIVLYCIMSEWGDKRGMSFWKSHFKTYYDVLFLSLIFLKPKISISSSFLFPVSCIYEIHQISSVVIIMWQLVLNVLFWCNVVRWTGSKYWFTLLFFYYSSYCYYYCCCCLS